MSNKVSILIDRVVKPYGYIVGRASGRVLPADESVGIMTKEVVDFELEVKAFAIEDPDTEVPLSDQAFRVIEEIAIDMLCEEDNGYDPYDYVV